MAQSLGWNLKTVTRHQSEEPPMENAAVVEPNGSNLITSNENCQRNEQETAWRPKWWRRFCSNPACPSYSELVSFVSVVVILILIWTLLFVLAPKLANPKSQFSNMVMLIVASYIAGTLLNKLTTLPGLIGMLFMGILLQNVGCVDLDGPFSSVTSELRKIAVVIILTRAGLSLELPTIKRLFVGIIKLGLIPWLVECIVIATLTHYIFHLPWEWAFMLGSIIASVSPAVVVPCFIKLRNDGYGVDKGIPTLILAAASIDDTISISVYGVISSIIFSQASLTNNILQGPVSLFGGIGFGVIWGFLLKYVPEKSDRYAPILRVLLLFFGCYGASSIANMLGYSGAGPLATIAASFLAGHNWSQDGWNVKDNPAVTAFRVSWILFEPTLFGITGASVKFHELDPQTVGLGAACLFGSVFIRIIATILVCYGTNFNMKEKIFTGISWMAKATVQAALGPVALDYVTKKHGTIEEYHYAKIILTISILSIILTAPLGAILISITGPKLLSKKVIVDFISNENSDNQRGVINKGSDYYHESEENHNSNK